MCRYPLCTPIRWLYVAKYVTYGLITPYNSSPLPLVQSFCATSNVVL